MGDLADDFKFMKEQRLKERAKIEPDRFAYAINLLSEKGFIISHSSPNEDKSITINGNIKLWPFTGWWSGKGIGSGRGIHQLIKKLEK